MTTLAFDLLHATGDAAAALGLDRLAVWAYEKAERVMTGG